MNIFKDIIYTYIIIAVSIVLHEFAHLITAWIIKLRVYRLIIGDEFLSIDIKGLRFSPLIFNGSVEFDVDSLYEKSKKNIIFFFLSGVIINLCLIILFYCFRKHFIYADYFIDVNLSIMFYSLIPLKFLKSDGYKLIKYLKNK